MAGDEIEAIKAIKEALTGLPDDETRVRVLQWAAGKFGKGQVQIAGGGRQPGEGADKGGKGGAKGKGGRGRAKPGKRPAKANAKLLGDLDLRPDGSKSFAEFVNEKKPASNAEKCLAAVYYVARVLKVTPIRVDHVYTCFKDASWRTPADLANTLSLVANRKGWLVTADRSNITLTARGENHIELDLPKKMEK